MKHGVVLENEITTRYSLHEEAKNYGECERIKHVGYIKTYKTGKYIKEHRYKVICTFIFRWAKLFK